MRRAVHFGGGSLGLGLVVERLVASGHAVTLIDTDVALVAAIRERGGYDALIHHPDRVETRFVAVADAWTIDGDPERFERALATADLITTSVRVENLPAVARALDASAAWRALREVRVVACENTVGSSRALAAALRSVTPWSPARIERTFLDAEVDRICQTQWPQRLAVATEPYAEWLVQAPSPTVGMVGGARVVADLDPYFDRKRSFVNAVADAAAFLGLPFGHAFLHEAVADPRVRALMAPALDDLTAFVARWPLFTRPDLVRYADGAWARLANPGIARRLDTVARDLRRKLGPQERFVAPALALLDAGTPPRGLARLIAALLDGADDALRAVDWVAAWGGDARARALHGLVAARGGAA